MIRLKGIDVSKYQGRINWGRVKADGVEFAMLRVGIAQADGNIAVDRCFFRNLKETKAAGVSVGVYVYLLAASADAAADAARQAIAMTEGYEITYPVAVDFEDRFYFSNSPDKNAQIAKGFLEETAKENFYPILYTYTAFAKEYLSMECLDDYALWIADYREQVGYDGGYTMLQYTDKGRIDGISTEVDLDISYVDYPALLREQGKNNLKPIEAGKWQIDIYSFRKKSRAQEVADAFKTLGFYCEVHPNGAEWRILMYSFREKKHAEEVSAAIRTLGYYNEVQPYRGI